MPVTSTLTKVTANGNDVATEFSFSPIVIFEASDLEVIHVDEDGVETTLSLGTGASNYSVAAATTFPGTGTVTYPADEVTPLPTGESLVIRRKLPLTQSVNLKNQGGYFPGTIEGIVDKLTMQVQQLQEQIDRAVLVPVGSDTETTELLDQLLTAAETVNQLLEDAIEQIDQLTEEFAQVENLTDVSITGLANGDILQHNGTFWANTALVQGAGHNVPFRGALVKLTADESYGGGELSIPWDAAEYDTLSCWSAGAPTRLTVVAGVTKVRIGLGAGFTSTITAESDMYFSIRKNGSEAFVGATQLGFEAGFTDPRASLWTPVLEVAAGDYFEATVVSSDTSAALDDARCWFALEIVEMSAAEEPPFFVEHFDPATPTASAVWHRFTATHAMTLPSSGGDSAASVVTNPSTQTDLDIQKNGVSVGTLRIATDGTDTWTVASAVALAAGDRLDLVAPADLNGLAGLSVTYALVLT